MGKNSNYFSYTKIPFILHKVRGQKIDEILSAII